MAGVFMNCNSHRARQKLTALVGKGKLQCYWSWEHPSKGGYFEIPEDMVERARKIPGVTKTKFSGEMRECW
jgi:hypothetical protein